MRRRTYRLSLVAVALVCLHLAGCSGGHSWGGGSEGDHGFKESVAFDYEITSLTCDGRVFLVLAADGCSGGSMTAARARTASCPRSMAARSRGLVPPETVRAGPPPSPARNLT